MPQRGGKRGFIPNGGRMTQPTPSVLCMEAWAGRSSLRKQEATHSLDGPPYPASMTVDIRPLGIALAFLDQTLGLAKNLASCARAGSCP